MCERGGAVANGASCREVNERGQELAFANFKHADGDGQLKAARAAGARIEVKDTLSVRDVWLVRMAVEDGGESGCCGVKVKRGEVVEQIEVVAFKEKYVCFRQVSTGTGTVDIAANGVDGSDLPERFEYLGVANVAEVKDVVDAAQGGPYLRTQQAVGVADDADLH